MEKIRDAYRHCQWAIEGTVIGHTSEARHIVDYALFVGGKPGATLSSGYQAVIKAGVVHILTVQVKAIGDTFVAVPEEGIVLHDDAKLQYPVNVNPAKVQGSAKGYDVGYDAAGHSRGADRIDYSSDTGNRVKENPIAVVNTF